MYLNYYSKIRQSINPAFNMDKEIKNNKGKIVTKIIDNTILSNTLLLKLYGLLSEQLRLNIAFEEKHENFSDCYHTFQIPKASGGYRTISAPNEELKELQKRITKIFTYSCRILPHNAAHAYVRKRNTLSEMKIHQAKGARWFLKLDIKNFFDNCVEPLVLDALYQMHPMKIISKKEKLQYIIAPCFLNGALPQGAPSSPFLSNILMMETDYNITQSLPTITYTRYADDMLFSSSTQFDVGFVISVVQKFLPIGMILNYEKTRYGNCNGANWNVGLMYNKDLDITVGHHNKKILKNILHNYFTGKDNAKSTAELKGLLSYYHYIEPVYFDNLMDKYKSKGFEL